MLALPKIAHVPPSQPGMRGRMIALFNRCRCYPPQGCSPTAFDPRPSFLRMAFVSLVCALTVLNVASTHILYRHTSLLSSFSLLCISILNYLSHFSLPIQAPRAFALVAIVRKTKLFVGDKQMRTITISRVVLPAPKERTKEKVIWVPGGVMRYDFLH